MLNRYEYISFDIFDTLIKRNVMNPKDIFIFVDERYKRKKGKKNELKDFVLQRINIEKKLRENKGKEITLNEIYNDLALIYGDDVASELKKIECEVEIDLCCPNLQVKSIYENCIKFEKKILIITDMYLNRDTIKKMLDKCGYEKYDKLYISSENRLTKESGELYKFIKKDLQIDETRWLHIGDNKKSDYNQAIKNGINAKLIKTIDNKLKYVNIKKNRDFIESRLNATLNNFSENKFEYYERLGYESFGPIVVGFVNWLVKEFKKENINKVYFLSRDGYIIKKIYDIIETEDVESHYLYVSRRSLQVPSFYIDSDYDTVLDSFFLPREIKFETLIKKLGLTFEEIAEVAEKYSFNKDTIIECKNIKSNKLFRQFYNVIKSKIIDNAKEEYLALVEYLKQNKFEGKVAIVDIGWFGNMQLALDKVIKHASIDAEIYGYYVGLIPEGDLQNRMNMKGYLFSANHNEDLHIKEKNFNSIFETCFLATHGSVKKYYFKDNVFNIEFYPYECKDSIMKKDIEIFQQGAIKFAEYWYSMSDAKYIDIDSRLAFETFCNIFIKPDIEIAKKIGDWRFFDIEETYIAKPNKLNQYIFNPKKFIKDLNTAPWKIGFLKRIFKIHFPYYKSWMMMRSIYKRYN